MIEAVESFSKYLLVFVGGGLGSCARLAISEAFGSKSGSFPWATLAANLTGALLLGVVMGALSRGWISGSARLFIAVGLLGGYTTFSTFCFEGVHLLRERQTGMYVGYVLVSVVGGLLLAWFGFLVTIGKQS